MMINNQAVVLTYIHQRYFMISFMMYYYDLCYLKYFSERLLIINYLID